jgi:hypothetical protein
MRGALNPSSASSVATLMKGPTFSIGGGASMSTAVSPLSFKRS